MPSANEIIPYLEMCRREGVSLQRGDELPPAWETLGDLNVYPT